MSKKDKIKDSFLEELRKIPIVTVACEKTNLSRNSVYRWKREDKKFSKSMDEAMVEGEKLVNDMSESQLLTLIKEKNFPAIRFWLSKRNSKFKDKIEVTAKMDMDDDLDNEQSGFVKHVLTLERLSKINKGNHDNSNK